MKSAPSPSLRLDPELREAQERLRQSAIGVWSDFRSNGVHVTLSEADVWLAKLEAGKDVELPECHA